MPAAHSTSSLYLRQLFSGVNRVSHIVLVALVLTVACPVPAPVGAEGVEVGDAPPPSPASVGGQPAAKATATPKPTPDPFKKLPKSGVISSSENVGVGGGTVGAFGETDLQGSELPPITASVSRVSPKEWSLKVFNNSEEGVNVSIKVEQRGVRGEIVKSDSFSYSLAAKQSVERSVNSSPQAAAATAILQSWKRTSKR